MSEEPRIVPDGVNPGRYIMADLHGSEYRNFQTLSEARAVEGAVAIMEGDYGGQIYFTCPVRHIHCHADALLRLLADLDAREWGDPEGARLDFEIVPPGHGVSGGMGGGVVCDGVWLHPDLEHCRASVEAVIAGTLERIGFTEPEEILFPALPSQAEEQPPKYSPTNDAITVFADDAGWTRCPTCGFRFNARSTTSIAGGMHLRCAQSLNVVFGESTDT